MDRQTILSGGLKLLSTEALPSLISAARLFPTPPDAAVMALVTIRSAGITVSFKEGTDPTASAVGNDYAAANTPYEFWMNAQEMAKVKAIQQAATTTGYISYFGVVG